MSSNAEQTDSNNKPVDVAALEKARREKMKRWRDELGLDPYGSRVDGLISLAEARALLDEEANNKFRDSQAAARENDSVEIIDNRNRAKVAGRIVQHRAMGKLVFLSLRDNTGDLQISISKADLPEAMFKLSKKLDYGDIIVAEGPVGKTQRGEVCVWADKIELHCKSLAPPPEKFHGLTDSELRYRHRSVDMYANPQTIQVFQLRSRLLGHMRKFMETWGYLEVETPMMQPVAGGAAARPFVTHHNTLDIDLYLRVAPELYLKRLLVGGLPRVFEINRNFRNEGVDRFHNPEFTALEAYEAFGDCWSMLDLTESLIHELALLVSGQDKPILPFGEMQIDYSRPFDRIRYDELFEKTLGFSITDIDKVRDKASGLSIKNADKLDDWLLVNEVYEHFCEPAIDPTHPTFVTDYPSVISPLTRPQRDQPHLCDRWELMIGGAEIGTAYSELNDPDIQRAKFSEQLSGADEEVETFRSLDEDFLYALMVGMPPAGGLGLGVDRIVMLMSNCLSIRDVILFPLLKPQES